MDSEKLPWKALGALHGRYFFLGHLNAHHIHNACSPEAFPLEMYERPRHWSSNAGCESARWSSHIWLTGDLWAGKRRRTTQPVRFQTNFHSQASDSTANIELNRAAIPGQDDPEFNAFIKAFSPESTSLDTHYSAPEVNAHASADDTSSKSRN